MKLATLFCLAWAAFAQTPPVRVLSPEVAPDRHVTFRFAAPHAAAVEVSGDFGLKTALTKDDQGIWSATVGPLDPDLYTYSFLVDSTRLTDPRNPRVKTGVTGSESIVAVPPATLAYWQEQPVSHGTVHVHTYNSAAIGDVRSE